MGRDRIVAWTAVRLGPRMVLLQQAKSGVARHVRSPVAWSLALYAALALAFWAPGLAESPRATILADGVIDTGAYLWFFGWWPHALLNGLNPFQTEAIFAPEGYNLAWVTSMPGPSLLLAPVTLTLGPVVTFNVISLASPALSAWTAFLLCRSVVGSLAPSLVGGYVFGFSPYMLGHLIGAPQLAFVALIPLFALLVLWRVRGSLGRRPFVLAMTAAMTAQFLTSTEVFATAALFGALTLAAAFGFFAELRDRLRDTAKLLVASLAATGVLVSPLLFYMLFRPYTVPEQALSPYPADLLALVIPSHRTAVNFYDAPPDTPTWVSTFPYLGVPLLVLIGLFAWSAWKRPQARLVLTAFCLTGVAMLGAHLQIGGDSTGIPLPWWIFGELPGLRYAIPARFAVYVVLAAALIVAMWLAWRPSAQRWALVVLVLISFAPAVWSEVWHTDLAEPPFFEKETYRTLLEPTDRVLTVPVWGPNMWWQAKERFPYRMTGGYVGAFPDSHASYPIWNVLLTGSPIDSSTPAELRRFVEDKDVTAIVVDASVPGEWAELFGTLGRPARAVDGVLLYRLAPAPPGD